MSSKVAVPRSFLLVLLMLLGLLVWWWTRPAEENPVIAGRHARDWAQGLEAKESAARIRTARILAAFGPKARCAAPALIKALDDADDHVRQAAAHALGSMGPDIIPTLLGVSKDKKFLSSEFAHTARQREGAITALGHVGPEAFAILLAMDEGRFGASPAHQVLFANAARLRPSEIFRLVQLHGEDIAIPRLAKGIAGNPETVAALQAQLKQGDKKLRFLAAELLCQWQVVEPALVPVLLEMMADESGRWFRCEGALSRLDRAGVAVLPAVREALKGKNIKQRLCILRILPELRPPGHLGAPLSHPRWLELRHVMLREVLPLTADPDPGIRASAVWACQSVEKNLQEELTTRWAAGLAGLVRRRSGARALALPEQSARAAPLGRRHGAAEGCPGNGAGDRIEVSHFSGSSLTALTA